MNQTRPLLTAVGYTGIIYLLSVAVAKRPAARRLVAVAIASVGPVSLGSAGAAAAVALGLALLFEPLAPKIAPKTRAITATIATGTPYFIQGLSPAGFFLWKAVGGKVACGCKKGVLSV